MAEERIQPIALHQEMQRSYLEYAMSVIVGRALPDVRDGLKPVQRRILFAMHELGLTPDRPYRKCARVVGDVLGKYHPHGDQAVYDALVRLVQTFASRHPLLDGHGNFGSVDDDPPAAMRYTETRLAPIANEAMLDEIGNDTVDFAANFDGSQQEPTVLPAQLPFLLLNGCSGIAVGMATSIPPHNLAEVVDALIALVHDPELSDEDLLKLVPGPDFPTGGEVLTGSGLRDTYLTGRGSIPMRGVAHIEEVQPGKGRHRRGAVVITELPYQLSKAGWIEKLAEQVNDGKIGGIADIRDESDRDGMRVVVEVRRDAEADKVLEELRRRTALQNNFGAILLALVNGQPQQLTLRQLLRDFLEYRELTLIRRIATRSALRGPARGGGRPDQGPGRAAPGDRHDPGSQRRRGGPGQPPGSAGSHRAAGRCGAGDAVAAAHRPGAGKSAQGGEGSEAGADGAAPSARRPGHAAGGDGQGTQGPEETPCHSTPHPARGGGR